MSEPILFFPLRVAVFRMGGAVAFARRFQVSRNTVARWLGNEEPDSPTEDVLDEIERESGVSKLSLQEHAQQVKAAYFRRKHGIDERTI